MRSDRTPARGRPRPGGVAARSVATHVALRAPPSPRRRPAPGAGPLGRRLHHASRRHHHEPPRSFPARAGRAEGPHALKSRWMSFSRRAVKHTCAFASLQGRHADIFAVAPREETVRRDVDVYGAPAAPRRAAHAHLSTNEYLELAGDQGLHVKPSARSSERRRPLPATRPSCIARPDYFRRRAWRNVIAGCRGSA